jgi:CheY-like chemotaxis protein
LGQSGRLDPTTILIVEDEPLVRLDIVDFFEDRGFRVFEAADAKAALRILESNPAIEIVLTDIQMPGSMDGLKLAHYVRDRWPPTLLIVASGMVKPRAEDLPSSAIFISKPFDPRAVMREIERLGAGPGR